MTAQSSSASTPSSSTTALQDLLMTNHDLSVTELLSDWQWLLPDDLDPQRLHIAMITKLGDAFLVDVASQHLYFLDTVDGELEAIAKDLGEFEALLADSDFVLDYFGSDLLAALPHQAMPANTVYSFELPPVLGGQVSASNLVLVDIREHFKATGQLWQQLSLITLQDLENHEDEDN